MNSFLKKIKNRFHTWRMRRKYFGRKGYAQATPDQFQFLKFALKKCIRDYENGTLPFPHLGICFNTGMLFAGKEIDPFAKSTCPIFLRMCSYFNEHRGLTKEQLKDITPAFPFGGDILNPWRGKDAEVRIEAMKWIVSEIDKYFLEWWD